MDNRNISLIHVWFDEIGNGNCEMIVVTMGLNIGTITIPSLNHMCSRIGINFKPCNL